MTSFPGLVVVASKPDRLGASSLDLWSKLSSNLSDFAAY
jgi:hypothetical protein